MLRLLLFTSLTLSCAHRAQPPTSDLSERLEVLRQARGRGVPDAAGPERLAGLHVLFVCGFLHELIPGYFLDNQAVVREFGATTSVLCPASSGSLEEDAELVRQEVEAIAADSHRSVVLVGHSKGGAAVALTVLRSPELVSNGKVAQVVSIQGAAGGSPVADGLLRAVPFTLFFKAFRGLPALERARVASAFDASPPSASLRQWCADHLWWIRSFETLDGSSTELQLSHAMLATQGSGRSDGLVLLEDQLRAGLGRDLGVLRGDHAAFTVSSPLSNQSAGFRRDFTRALLEQVSTALGR